MPFFGGSKTSSSTSTTVTNNQTSIDGSANGAGAQSVTASQRSTVNLDQRSGYVESRGASTSRIDGDSNLVLGTGATYSHVEQLGDEVVSRALDSVDRTTAGAFAFGGDALALADRTFARSGAQLQGAVDLADAVARRSAEYADASRLTIERIADPASSTSRTILYVVAGLAALAVFVFRPRKPKASA